MAYVKNLFDQNFIQYASYVIRDRAIPELVDGLKPVQRRILHTLLEIDDGRMHKVAGVAGDCMKIHPHGDASIMTALVNLANKELFIDKQGNFGNMYTGDSAAAGRYIECRIKPITKDIIYNPKITQYVPSYDGRTKEPVVFRAKLPLVVILGADGIAVGLSTQILSHNVHEVIEAEKACPPIIGHLLGTTAEINGNTLTILNYNTVLPMIFPVVKDKLTDVVRRITGQNDLSVKLG